MTWWCRSAASGPARSQHPRGLALQQSGVRARPCASGTTVACSHRAKTPEPTRPIPAGPRSGPSGGTPLSPRIYTAGPGDHELRRWPHRINRL